MAHNVAVRKMRNGLEPARQGITAPAQAVGIGVVTAAAGFGLAAIGIAA